MTRTAPVSRRATGLVADFSDAGVLTVADVQVAATLVRLSPEPSASDEVVALAAALCVHTLRNGSVALDLAAVRADVGTDEDVVDSEGLPWPDVAEWTAACRGHRLVADGAMGPSDRPLRWDSGLLYLQRYWQYEDFVAEQVARRTRARLPGIDTELAARTVADLFPDAESQSQRLAAAVAATTKFMIMAGGPGTGKTTTIARLLVLLHALHGPKLQVALAAPTGKAASRITEATAAELRHLFQDGQRPYQGVAPFAPPAATTVHKLLGGRPGASRRFHHDRHNPLPHDVVIVDEVSMVPLVLMARLMEAVRPESRFVLVGDPGQLASIEAGAILADLVSVDVPAPAEVASAAQRVAGPTASQEELPVTGVVTLRHNFRSEQRIARLAAAIRAGDGDDVVARLREPDVGSDAGPGEVVFFETDPGMLPEQAAGIEGIRREVVDRISAITAAAAQGDAVTALRELGRHRVLCAHREGPFGAAHWNRLVESWRRAEHGPPAQVGGWRIGQCLILTANDPGLSLSNGDSGVVVATPDGPRAAFAPDGGLQLIPPARLDAYLSLDAMTIHRGQGSQFDAVTVILPPPTSPLLTRELFYTAVTRARSRVQLIGSADAVVAAVQRRAVRVSGLEPALRRRLSAG